MSLAVGKAEPQEKPFRNDAEGRGAMIDFLWKFAERHDSGRIVLVYEASGQGYGLYDQPGPTCWPGTRQEGDRGHHAPPGIRLWHAALAAGVSSDLKARPMPPPRQDAPAAPPRQDAPDESRR